MSTEKFTQGPWVWEKGCKYVHEESTGATVALVCEDDGHLDAQQRLDMPFAANANLIAAGPDLYAACEALMHRMEVNELLGKDDTLGRYDQAAYDAAKAALSKARGGT